MSRFVNMSCYEAENSDARGRAADALGTAFQHLAAKEQAWKELLALTKDQDSGVRSMHLSLSSLLYPVDRRYAQTAKKKLPAKTAEHALIHGIKSRVSITAKGLEIT